MSQKERIAALEAQLKQMQQMLGVRGDQAAQPSGPDPNFIAHGSEEHLAMLGLIRIEKDEKEENLKGFQTFISPDSGKRYRLADELQAIYHYPGLDPDKAIILLLRSKISNFESGPPQVPADAPPLMMMDINEWES